MERQTVYYSGTPMGPPQGMDAVKIGGSFVQSSLGEGATQAVYYTPAGQSQQRPPMAISMSPITYYSPQPQQNFYVAQPPQYTPTFVPMRPEVYTIGASPQHQNPQSTPSSQLFNASSQLPSRAVYASSAQPQYSEAQFQPQIVQTQYQPPPSHIQYHPPQAASPTRVVQYSPQTFVQVQPSKAQPVSNDLPQQQIHAVSRQVEIQPVAHQLQQTMYQPSQTPLSATQLQVGNINQLPQQHQMLVQQPTQRQQIQQQPILQQRMQSQPYQQVQEVGHQVTSLQSMERAAPGVFPSPQPQYHPPQQSGLQQPMATQQRKPVYETHPQRSANNPSGDTTKLRQLQPRRSMDGGDTKAPPQFLQHPLPQVTVTDGNSLTLKAVVKPTGDSTLQVQWFKNGAVPPASSRHVAILDRVYAEYQFLYTNVSDSGEYYCEARTANGLARSNSCQVTILSDDNVVTESQLPEESMIMNLAAIENQLSMNATSRIEEEVEFPYPPQFVRPLLPQLGLKENERAKFEAFVQPFNDPSLTLEWFKDGEPLKTGCRFTETLDRGYVILDIHYTYPEDSGQYSCVAKNNAGTTSSNIVELSCKGGTGIVTDSVLSAESVHYLQSLDSLEVSPSQEQRYAEPELQPAPPVFELEPKDTTIIEGSPFRLLVKAGGNPCPQIQWLVNDDVLPTSGGGGTWRIYNDGGISYLEFNRCGPPGEYTVTTVAKNDFGESTAGCTLIIDPQPDYRPDLKHIALDNPFRRLESLKRVERSEELKNALEKTKPKALELRKLERRNSQTGGLNDTEVMYAQVQGSLRSNRRSIQRESEVQRQAPVPPPPPSLPPAPPTQYQSGPLKPDYEIGNVSTTETDNQQGFTSPNTGLNIEL